MSAAHLLDSALLGLSNSDADPLSDDFAATTATRGVAEVRGKTIGQIETAGDTDWFAVTLEAGVAYQFVADTLIAPLGPGALGNPKLRLLDTSGQPVAIDDDSYVGTDALIQFTPQSGGRWFLEVSGATGGPATGSYALIVQADSGRNKPSQLVSYTLSGQRLEVIFDTPIDRITWNGNVLAERGKGATLSPISLQGTPEVSGRSILFNLSEPIAGDEYLLLRGTALPSPRVVTAFESFALFDDTTTSLILGADGDTFIDASSLPGDVDILDLGGNNRFVTGATFRAAITGGAGNDQYLVSRADTPIQDLGGTDSATVLSSGTKLPSDIETVTLGAGAAPLPYWISALVADEGAGQRFSQLLPDGRTYLYAFPQTAPDYLDARYTAGFKGFSTAQATQAENALRLIAAATGLRFVASGSAAADDLISFGLNTQVGSGGYAVHPRGEWLGSDVFLNVSTIGNTDLADGTYGAYALIHEIGHALGLKHPFSAADATGEKAEPPYLSSAEDQSAFTVMTYTVANADRMIRLAPLDVAALQYLYGPNPDARADASRYTVSLSTANFIWDGGGRDVIDLGALTVAADVSLEPGYWGYAGSARAAVITAPGQVTVNFGTMIEDLVGTPFSDRLAGNSLANIIRAGAGHDTVDAGAGDDSLEGGAGRDRLIGGPGNDTLAGGIGSDTMVGGEGTDLARLEGNRAEWQLYANADRSEIAAFNRSTLELDRLLSIEAMQFVDGTRTLAALGDAGALVAESADFGISEVSAAKLPAQTLGTLWTGSLPAADTDGLRITVPAGHRLMSASLIDLAGDAPQSALGWSLKSLAAAGTTQTLATGTLAMIEAKPLVLANALVPGNYLLELANTSPGATAEYGVALVLKRVNTRPTGGVDITATPRAGELLTANITLIDPDGIPAAGETGAPTYQWRSNGAAIAGATSSTYRASAADVGSRLSVSVTYTDLGGTIETVTSSPSAAVISPLAVPAANYSTLPRVLLKTSLGDAVIELEADRAPVTVANFLRYATTDFYDGTEFHRIISTFMAQGGGYDLVNGNFVRRSKTSSPSYTVFDPIPLERTSATGLSNLTGTLAMARTNAADSATSEFFINLVDNLFLDAAYSSDGNGYAVFGRIASGGTELMTKLKAVPVVNNGSGEISKPTVAVTLNDVVPAAAPVSAAAIGSVVISGTLRQGQTISANASLADPDGIPSAGPGAITYFWTADSGAGAQFITGAVSSTLLLTPALLGKALRAHAEYTDLSGVTAVVASDPVTVSEMNDRPSGRVWITGSPVAGATLNAAHDVADVDGIPGTGQNGAPAWQWRVNGNLVAGASGSTFAVLPAYAGQSITASISYTDLGGTAESVSSAPAGSQTASPAPELPRVFMRTNYGDLLIELESQKAPISSSNFLKYVDNGFYDGSVIHRVLTGSVVQGGGFSIAQDTTTGQYYYAPKALPANSTIKLERTSLTGLSNTTGTIAMARGDAADTASSQFFFNLRDNSSVYDAATGRDGYAVFGRVIDGLPTLAFINQVRTGAAPGPSTTTLSNAPLSIVQVPFAYSDLHPPSGDVFITGTLQQGQTLSASHTLSDVDGGISSVSYQWRANGIPLNGATSNSLLLTQALVGKSISVAAIYLDGVNAALKYLQNGYVVSAATAPVADLDDLPTGAVRIDGLPIAGTTLNASHSLSDLDNGLTAPAVTSVGWQWFAGSEPISGATASSLKLTTALVGAPISVRAFYTDAANRPNEISSAATEPVRAAALTGSIYHWKSHALLDDVDVSAQAQTVTSTAPPAAALANSGIDGRWTIDGLDFDGLLRVSASREAGAGEIARAVSAADALAALKLATGRTPNPLAGDGSSSAAPVSPYQVLAADVDRDGKVTQNDANAILKIALGLDEAPTAGWRFAGETEALWNTTTGSVYTRNAVAASDKAVSARAGQSASVNLVGVLTGDVDGSWTPGDIEPLPARAYDQLPTEYFQSLGLAPEALAQWGL